MTYDVTLDGTGEGAIGGGRYKADAMVNIYAGTKEGYTFNGWTSDDGVIFARREERGNELHDARQKCHCHR